ncbi:tRNA1(Val) (adenine(37)-N6)-methyltransferase [uncultured Enterovirga sp.]|uniref:tRNA1(Val) (adenine(37)-N6)-methyltransferase n=1 Tax=uncultured Enterovirga sp. TaxID=2026352 RepID=UPI0035C9909D
MTPDAIPEVTEDLFLEGRLRLLQPRRGHRAGTDAVLLAATAEIRPGDHVVDLGSASGAVGLMAAIRVGATRLSLVEREAILVTLARRNISSNGLEDRAAAYQADLFADRRTLRSAGLADGMADVVLTNPPFFEPGGRTSPDPGRRSAHVMEGGDLGRWVASANWLLRPRGRIWMIHRADALASCLEALRPTFGSIVVRPVYSKPGGAAARLILSALKGGRTPLEVAAPIHLGEADAAADAETKTVPAGGLPGPEKPDL